MDTTLAAAFGLAGAAAATTVAAVAWGSISPTSRLWGRVYYRGDNSQNHYALTFDDGPTPGSTCAILDKLGELGVRAAFFVIGTNAQRHPQLVARMHEEHHLVCNHSFDHAHLGTMHGGRYWRQQIQQTDEVIEHITGLRPRLFRPPMGVKTWSIHRSAARLGHSVVTWSGRAMDGVDTHPQRILDRLVPTTTAGDVLALHDGVEPNSQRDPAATVAAVEPLILGLRDRRLEPVRLDALLGLAGYAQRGEKSP